MLPFRHVTGDVRQLSPADGLYSCVPFSSHRPSVAPLSTATRRDAVGSDKMNGVGFPMISDFGNRVTVEILKAGNRHSSCFFGGGGPMWHTLRSAAETSAVRPVRCHHISTSTDGVPRASHASSHTVVGKAHPEET